MSGPTAAGDDPIAVLEDRIGYAFAAREHALAALTHRSYKNEQPAGAAVDNERLEFLGDAVVDLAISHRLMQRDPEASEGELSKLRAVLVDEEGLARVAREMRLGELMRVGRGEDRTGGRDRASLLADTLEAVIGAVFVDGGLNAAQHVIDRLFGAAMDQVAATGPARDYKTRLQELSQGQTGTAPRYRVVEERGPDHLKEFVIELALNGAVVARGAGRSKKEAEQAAAQEALSRLNAGTGLPELAAAPPAAPTSPRRRRKRRARRRRRAAATTP